MIPYKLRGVKYFDKYKESGIKFYLFKRLNVLELEATIDNYDLYPYYRGIGLPFANAPCIKHTRFKTLITQMFGWDV